MLMEQISKCTHRELFQLNLTLEIIYLHSLFMAHQGSDSRLGTTLQGDKVHGSPYCFTSYHSHQHSVDHWAMISNLALDIPWPIVLRPYSISQPTENLLTELLTNYRWVSHNFEYMLQNTTHIQDISTPLEDTS
jgi:hypothetical protein